VGTTDDMNILSHIRTRIVLLVLVGVIVLGVGAGFAFASNKPAPIGTGVVVINTNLAYQNASAAGTGIVLSSSGEILTNNHVISGATTIKVVLPGTGHSYTAHVVGYNRTADVAVIQTTGASNLKTASLGSSSKVTVGQAVTARGNAGGTGALTSVTGTVTGLAKTITASDDQGSTEQLTGLIETNAAVQPGDSGGPLLNSSGQVIGMDTAASTGFGGFQNVAASDAYAIPITKAQTIAKQIESGTASATVHIGATAFLGVQVQSVGNGFGPGAQTGTGAMIAGVVSGGPAAAAGLVAGDVITAINGQAVASPTAITSSILAMKPGAKVAITYTDQSGVSQTAQVTLGSGPAQ
jgi:S1-C subfamily serine protease